MSSPPPPVSSHRKSTSAAPSLPAALTCLLGGGVVVYALLWKQVDTRSFSSHNDGDLRARLLEDRVQYLETKLNAYLAFTSDPFLSAKLPARCHERMNIQDLACRKGTRCVLDNPNVCLDNFPHVSGKAGYDASVKEAGGSALRGSANSNKKEGPPCVVYDFGVREDPHYGFAFTKAPFNCQVVGFDPSPISVKWWQSNQEKIRRDHPTYDFREYGAGGEDGLLELKEYDWGQVSILRYPTSVVNINNCTSDGCRYKKYDQKGFHIPVKTLKSAMAELGHRRVDLLKLDVEGSEYMFLERMIDDLTCRRVDQLTLEWHHYDHDSRYGFASLPQINVLVALLKDRCGLEQFQLHSAEGWPSNKRIYVEMGMNLYYNLASFKRTRWAF